MTSDLDARGWKARAEQAEATLVAMRLAAETVVASHARELGRQDAELTDLRAALAAMTEERDLEVANREFWGADNDQLAAERDRLRAAMPLLLRVARAAKAYKAKQDLHGETGKPVAGHFEAWTELLKALQAL